MLLLTGFDEKSPVSYPRSNPHCAMRILIGSLSLSILAFARFANGL